MSFDPELVAEAILQMVKAAIAAELQTRVARSNEDVIADVIVQGIKKATAPIREDQAQLRAELQMLRVELRDAQTRLAALDVAEAPAALARHTLQ
jgi:hypothetical protein